MCGICGFPSAAGHWTEGGLADSARDRLRDRFRRTQVLQSVLPLYGLAAHEGVMTPGILVTSMTGDQTIASDLTEVWRVAEKLASQVIDPLDPRFTGPMDRDDDEAA